MDNKDDHLLTVLLKLCELHHKPTSSINLIAGLPLVNNRLTPQLFVRAAERHGFMAKITEQKLLKISPLVLPVVLLLKDDKACILMKYTDTQAEIYSSEFHEHLQTISLAELEKVYTGFAILIQPLTTYDQETATKQSKSWFWGTLWDYRSTYYDVLFGAMLINILTLAVPLFTMNVYDRVVPNNAMITLWVLTIGMVILLLFDLIFRFMRMYLIDITGKKADIVIASKLFNQILNLQLIKKPKSTGELVNTLREFESIRDFITSSTLTTLIDIPFVIIFIAFIAYLSFPVALVSIIAIPILICLALIIQKNLHKVVKEANYAAAKKNGILFENLGGLETIKSLNAQGVAQFKWENIVAVSSRLNLKSRFLSGSMVNVTYFIQQFVIIATIVVGVYQIEAGTLSLGGLIACSILSGRAVGPLGQFANIITRFQQARTALQDINKLMAEPSELDEAQTFISRPILKGDIEFRDVTFSYPDQSRPALNNISFKITPGERIGLLGHIGSGKTTIHKLLLKLYQPQKGAIYIDGMDINQLDPAEIRKSIGYIPQETILFSGSLRDNIALSMPWSSDNAIIRASEVSGAIKFINKHPEGFNLNIGERGEGLSGGQRQLISITRGLVADPPIILMDEPTSAMDDLSEQALINHMLPYLQAKTLILITHKLTMLRLVNRLIILDNGRIVLDGPKEQVLAAINRNQTKKQAL
ncbi:type I secretion system permease/ATPase [Legionella sp. CNM-1927-20]|uniref:type I secretion system permease/ATPase n=1 Tax=Legionella sp. CNM-1927-20 TaxID=3422221 RepID=UPI00403B0EF3